MESEGLTVLRSPKALEYQRNGGDLRDLAFHAERGTGQGDVASSLIWIAVFDILLCALDEIQSNPIWTTNKDGVLKPTKSIAYADDLFTLQS
jgi:hypothetical protein